MKKNVMSFKTFLEAHVMKSTADEHHALLKDQLPHVKETYDKLFADSKAKFGNVNVDNTRMYFLNDEKMTPYPLKGEFGRAGRKYSDANEKEVKARETKGEVKFTKDQIMDFLKKNLGGDTTIKSFNIDFKGNNIDITRFNERINREETKKIGITTYLKKLEKSFDPKVIGDYINSFNANEERQGVNLAEMKTLICISRDTDDLCGMSTNKGWASCMNFKDGGNTQYIKGDIKYGTLIAMQIKENDLDCESPSGRVLLKPFFQE